METDLKHKFQMVKTGYDGKMTLARHVAIRDMLLAKRGDSAHNSRTRAAREQAMSLESMAFILGGIFIAAGLFGGGLEIKEIKLPQIAGTARILAMATGVLFVLLALAINLRWVEHTTAEAQADTETSSRQRFDAPLLDGMRLDVCVEWGSRCGEEAANAWCRTQGYARAVEHATENVGSRGIATKLIGTRQLCQAKYCAAFQQITCGR